MEMNNLVINMEINPNTQKKKKNNFRQNIRRGRRLNQF